MRTTLICRAFAHHATEPRPQESEATKAHQSHRACGLHRHALVARARLAQRPHPPLDDLALIALSVIVTVLLALGFRRSDQT